MACDVDDDNDNNKDSIHDGATRNQPRAGEDDLMAKPTAIDRLMSWRASAAADVRTVRERVTELISEAKRLRTDARRIVGGIAGSVEKLGQALDGEIEDRQIRIMSAFASKYGPEQARLMVDSDDWPDTSREDERDEGARDGVYNLEFPDVEDSMDQVISSLDDLDDGLEQLLNGLKEIS